MSRFVLLGLAILFGTLFMSERRATAASTVQLSVSPAEVAVAASGSFTIDLRHTSAGSTTGAQADVVFDQARVELLSVALGAPYAGGVLMVNDGDFTLPESIVQANANGRLENAAAVSLSGALAPGTHTLIVLGFQARQTSGPSQIALQDLIAMDGSYLGVSASATSGWVGVAHATNDSDADGVQDASDNCPSTVNPSQLNNDRNFIRLNPPKAYDDLTLVRSDALGDVCDSDDDNDGRSDAHEIGGVGCYGAITDPLKADTDGDRALDGAECVLERNPLSTASAPTVTMCGDTTDADGDGIIARNEYCYYGSDPASGNSDGDGCGDGREMASINADLTVNSSDLGQVAGAFGAYSFGAEAHKYNFDLNKDGTISAIDLNLLQAQFGACP